MKECGIQIPTQVPVSVDIFHQNSPAVPSSSPQGAHHQPNGTDGSYLRKPSVLSNSSDNKNVASDTPVGCGNPKSQTFFSEHKGKIAVGTVDTLLIIGGVIAAFVLGQPLIGGIAAVVGAAMLLTVGLAMTTEKGKEMWNEASKNLSDLFVSKQEPQQQI